MIEPLSLETILKECSEDSVAWVLKAQNGQDLFIPHHAYPGRQIIHLFMSKEDADSALIEVLKATPNLADQKITAHSVLLLSAMRTIAAFQKSQPEVGFAVHPPGSAKEFIGIGATVKH